MVATWWRADGQLLWLWLTDTEDIAAVEDTGVFEIVFRLDNCQGWWSWRKSVVIGEIWCGVNPYQEARFMGPTWGPSGAGRTQVGPMLAPYTLLSGLKTGSIFRNVDLVSDDRSLHMYCFAWNWSNAIDISQHCCYQWSSGALAPGHQ